MTAITTSHAAAAHHAAHAAPAQHAASVHQHGAFSPLQTPTVTGGGAAQAAYGTVGIKPPNTALTILKNVALFGGAGAAIGFGASFLTLPVIGQVAAPIAAAVGGGIGAVIGLARGLSKANQQKQQHQLGMSIVQSAGIPMQAVPVQQAPVPIKEK